jgi:hypothetical protein
MFSLHTRTYLAYVKRLEDFIVRLDDTFAAIETARGQGKLGCDLLKLRREAERIRDSREAKKT